MQTDNLDYFRRRAEEERRCAAASGDQAVAAAHLRMAEEYRKRIDELSGEAQSPAMAMPLSAA